MRPFFLYVYLDNFLHLKTLLLQFWHISAVLLCCITATSLFHQLTVILVDRVIDDAGAKGSEHLVILFPVLLTFLKDNNPIVVKQSVITGTKVFSCVLEELALQVSFSSLYSHSLHVCLCKCVSVSISVDGTVCLCALKFCMLFLYVHMHIFLVFL